MSISELIQTATIWLKWAGLGLGFLALVSFLFGWGVKYRLTGTTIFTLLLSASCWAFNQSYTPPVKVEGYKYAPIVYDNGFDLVVAQASEDFPDEAIKPTLEQIARNLKGGGRNGSVVDVRIRKVKTTGEGVSKPIIIGQVLRDIKDATTRDISPKTEEVPKENNEVAEYEETEIEINEPSNPI